MIKSILSDQSESEKLVERYNELYSQLTDENVPDFGSNPVLSSFSTSTGPINVMNRNISTTQNIPRSGGVEAAARPSNTGFALPTDYFQSKSRESSNSHYTSSSSQYRPPIRVTGISPSIPSSSSSSQYRYGAVQTSSHRNTTQNRNNDVKVVASYPLYGQSTSYSLDVPIQGLKKSVGPSYYPRLQAAISSSDYRKMHKPNDDVTAGDYRPYMHANETDGFSYDQRRAYNAVKKVSQAESIPPSHTGAQSDAPSTAGGIEESNPNAVTNRGDQDIGDNPNPTLHPGHASGDTETLIVEINTEMSDQAL